ncbi:MAG: transposase [Caldilineaceae bacterium]
MQNQNPSFHRKSIRLPGYDYTRPGAYFVTICTHQHEHLFGQITDHTMVYSPYGQIADQQWRALPDHFNLVRLDAWVIMPNHQHGIIQIVDHHLVGARQAQEPILHFPDRHAPASPLEGTPPTRPNGTPAGSLGAIIGTFKSLTTRAINQMRNAPGMPVWQRNYYEHIIRTEKALQAIRSYITENPQRWALDRYHPAPTGVDPRAAEIWRLLRE